MEAYSLFMLAHRAKDVFTHTRIPDKKQNIYGGTYFIPDEDLNTFYQLYKDYVFQKGFKEYLTEKQGGFCIAIDLDFRYNRDITTRQHNYDDIFEIIYLYLDEIKKILVINDEQKFNIFVFEKPNVNCLEDKTKDGIHIIFGLQMSFENQLELRSIMIKKLKCVFDKLPLINSIEEVLDEGISKGSTNWQLFGSRKPGNEDYKLTKYYQCSFDYLNDYQDMIIESDFDLQNNFNQISVQYKGNPKYDEIKTKDTNKSNKPKKQNIKKSLIIEEDEEDKAYESDKTDETEKIYDTETDDKKIQKINKILPLLYNFLPL